MQQLAAAPADPRAETGEQRILRERFEQALAALRKARFESARGVWGSLWARAGKRYLYELPWYIIIGAPGSGKTTALLNSGLRFPLAAADGGARAKKGIGGVGGTRNCDWWFTEQAVLIDTAGRYTTHDSDRDADRGAWASFMQLLKKSRPRQPVNGVLVTVSVADLLTRSAAERSEHAQAVRNRVQELHEQLGVRFPIYLLVTKCDLLAGFMDYLGDADKDARATPWGFTFPLDGEAKLGLEFDRLERRLVDGLITRLARERDVERRARIYAFPQQFAGLKAVLDEFVRDVFSPSQFEARPMLRGVYFVSGTQEGTPLDRMLGRLSRAFRLERQVLPPNLASGKSFFLERLLQEVVFAESELGGTDLKWERRRGALAIAGYAAIVLVALGAFVAWIGSYYDNQRYVAAVGSRVDAVQQALKGLPEKPSPDVVSLLPMLKATQDLDAVQPNQGSVGFGLSQEGKLGSASDQAYQRLLVNALLPRIAARVEEQLRSSSTNPELQYEMLKTYLMLHDAEHFDAKTLKAVLGAEWDANLPRSVSVEQRERLVAHLDALLAEGHAVSPVPLDKALVAQTRARLVVTPLPQRIYSRLKRQGVGEDIPEFTIAKAGGSAAPLVFVRASGKPLTQGVAGLYTYDGYHRGLQREVERVSGQLASEEAWVLGTAGARERQVSAQVADEVRRLYLNDYAAIWESFIADIKLLPADSLSKSVAAAQYLSEPNGPLVLLMRALSRETTLLATDARSAVEKAQDKAQGVARQAAQEVRRLFGEGPLASARDAGPARLERIVDDRFQGLRQLVAQPPGGGASPIDRTVALINEVHLMLVAAQTATQGGNPPPPSDVPNKVKAEAPRMPEPMRSLLTTLAASGAKGALVVTRDNFGKLINAQIGDFCRRAIAGRYPLSRTSEREVTQDDFARMFAPGGLMDDFFQKHLVAFVDVSTRPWSFRAVAGTSMGTDTGTLMQFQRAAEIRSTFFRAGGTAPSLKLEFKPLEMDTTITQFVLDVDGQVVKYAHGPQIPTAVQWPGPRGSTQVRVMLQPTSASGPSGVTTDGPWALFRLFDKLQLTSGNAPERFAAVFNVSGRKTTYEVTTSSVQNPFRLRELSEFACPGGL